MPRLVSGIFLVIFLLCVFTLGYKTQPANASSSTIYINPDGSIKPASANITTSDNVTYTLTSNNYLPIVVNRSNIIINGHSHWLYALGLNGLSISGVSNVTIENTTITNNYYGINIYDSSGNVLSQNQITNNIYAIGIHSSSGNNISRNNVAVNNYGIEFSNSTNNSIDRNNITSNYIGIQFIQQSDDNKIFRNNITTNGGYGIDFDYSSNNTVYHNNFVNNTSQAHCNNSLNTWDNGSVYGGNYWSDYTTMYPNASEIDSSGIWNTPYVIDANNIDHYPIMKQPIIPEFPSYLILPFVMMATLLAVVIFRGKHLDYKSSG